MTLPSGYLTQPFHTKLNRDRSFPGYSELAVPPADRPAGTGVKLDTTAREGPAAGRWGDVVLQRQAQGHARVLHDGGEGAHHRRS